MPIHPPSRLSCLTAAVLGLLALGCEAQPPRELPPARPPDVLLVTVDTLRPDALGFVSGSDATPVVDRLAAEGFRFPAAASPAPLTAPSHVSMMSGLLPRRHGIRDNGQVLGAAPPLLAEVLRGRGYATAAFVSGYPLKGFFGLERGFDHYDDELTAGEGAWLERPASATTAAALAWVATAPRPFFLWVHYYDPHFPYEPPPGLRRDGWRGAYDGEVAAVDRALGELLRGLGDGPRLTVFAGDHGESLGEHGEGTHGFFIYESTVRVPLVVHFPGRVEPGESAAAARLLDVAPTILDLLGLDLLGLEPPAEADGVSLGPTLDGEAQELPPAYVETRQPWTSYGWAPLRSVRDGGFKLIAAPRPELYDLGNDPGETTNLVDAERPRARRLKARLEALEALPPVGTAAQASDPETLEALRALGYVGGGAPAGEPGPGLPDPKDKIATRELLTEADELVRRGDFRGALERFDRVLAEEPKNHFALSRSGAALLSAGDFEAAAARLGEAARLHPGQAETRELLAEALTRAGQVEAALGEWMEVVRLQPGRARAWSNLGSTLGRAGRVGEAIEALAKAAELEPGSAERWIRLAFAEHAAGDVPAAVTHLGKAADLAGDGFAHWGALGILRADLGRRDEAREALSKSRPGEGDFAQARFRLALLEAEDGRTEAARRALAEALAAAPELRPRAAANPRLAPLLR